MRAPVVRRQDGTLGYRDIPVPMEWRDRLWRLWLTGFTSMNNRNPPFHRGGFFSSSIRQPAVTGFLDLFQDILLIAFKEM